MDGPDEPPRAHTLATLVIVVVVVGHASLPPLRMIDAYPFAIYPMYAQVRHDPYAAHQVVFVPEAGTSEEGVLSPPVSRSVMRDLATGGDVDTLSAIAEQLGARLGARRVDVVLEQLVVSRHPAPPALTVQDRSELATVER